MSRKRFTVEQIVQKLRDAEVELAKGQTITHDLTPIVVQCQC